MAKKSLPWGARLLIATVLLAAVAVGLFSWWKRPQPPPALPPQQAQVPTIPDLTPEQVQQVTQQLKLGLGYLDSDRFVEADRVFTELGGQFPGQPFPIRNLAIARLLQWQSTRSDAEPAVAAAVDEAIRRLETIEPRTATTYWLAATVSLEKSERATDEESRNRYLQAALFDFERALPLAANNAVFFASYYAAGRFHSDSTIITKAREALRRAYELRSDNLYLLTEWLSVQTEIKSPDILRTLENAQRILAPLVAPIQRRTRVDVREFLDQAKQAVEAGDWETARRRVLPLMGVIRSEEVTQSDMRRVWDANPLEFVISDFPAEFYLRYPVTPAKVPLEPLQFSLSPLPSASAWTDVQDVRLVDMDLDDKLDLLLLRSGRVEVYSWPLDAAPPVPRFFVELPAEFSQLLVADLDQDTSSSSAPAAAGEQGAKPAREQGAKPAGGAEGAAPCAAADGDVVCYGRAGWIVLRNQLGDEGRTRTLERVEQTEEGLGQDSAVQAATLVDLDHDGDLDLAVSTDQGFRLLSNRGLLLFEDISPYSTLPPRETQFERIEIVDWDRDVDIDLVLSGPGAAAGWLESLRHGQFRWRPFESEFVPDTGAAAVVPLELDGKPSWDLAAAGTFGIRSVLTRSTPAGRLAIYRQETATESESGQLIAGDFDNNGTPDLLARTGGRHQLYRRSPDGAWQTSGSEGFNGLEAVNFRQLGDFDGDGDLDLVGVSEGQLQLVVGAGQPPFRSVALQLRGGADNVSGRVNQWAIGSLVELMAGTMYQAQVVTERTTHFGLGTSEQPDVVRILWTQGIPQSIIRPPTNTVVCEPMTLKGSCPYLYAWSGERCEFVTDLLWAAPLGLQFADGVIAPDRPWEYLKIEGRRLQPRQGRYALQVTEELWEAAYFDQVELLAVDHPSDWELYSNEKVGNAEIAAFKLHTVRQRRPLVSAQDQRGRDWTAELTTADGKVVQAFDRTYRQGLAEPHTLELDLGDLNSPRQLMLFLTGWIRPTDTSLNVALSHHPTLSGPKPPSLWVPDGNGGWREALPFMGFPGGKTKTIAVDLSSISFPEHDYRVRIATSAELYWDEAFFSLDEAAGEVAVQTLPLLAADLHYRGFSAAIPGPRTQPETYDYAQVSRQAKWPPMRGRFTRFGDVAELLRETDARMVIMSSGDEMTLEFAVPDSAIPDGWQRDFILHNVGWDKDADLNTVFGQTVEPLPYVGMPSYPYSDDSFPNDPEHRDYLRKFQTRESSRQAFWSSLLVDGEGQR